MSQLLSTKLVAPEPVTAERIIHEEFGRRMFEQSYRYPDERMERFVLFGASASPVLVLPLTVDHEVVVVRQFRHGMNEFVLEVPGGNPKRGQTHEDVVWSELAEETGYRPGGLLRLGEPLRIDPASFRVTGIAMVAYDCVKIGDPKPDKTEVMETLVFPADEWVRMCRRGEVTDCKTLAVTMRAEEFLLGQADPRS